MSILSWFRPKKEKPKDQPSVPTVEAVNAASASTKSFTLPTGMTLLCTLNKGYTVESVAWSPDGKLLAIGNRDQTDLWDPLSDSLLHTLTGHDGLVESVAWSPDGKLLATGSRDRTIRLWDPVSSLPHTLEGHTDSVGSVAWSPDGKLLATGSNDQTIRLWDPVSGRLLRILTGHADWIESVAWSSDGKLLATGSRDRTIQLWDPVSGRLLRTLTGHADSVRSVAWSPDGKLLATGSNDQTIRLWNPVSGRLLHTLEGHADWVRSVAWSPDGKLLASHSYKDDFLTLNDDVSIWRTDTWETVAVLTHLKGFTLSSWNPVFPVLATIGRQRSEVAIWLLDLGYLLRVAASPETVHYTNAKVVLLGDSGVGKSGLGLVLSQQPFTATESTHGRRVWDFDQQEVSLGDHFKETRETLLWDLAGQPGYRLIHQLHLDEVAVALVVFDAHSETDPFAGVQHWDKALRLAQRIEGSSAIPLKKLLVAARTDRGGIGVSAERVEAVVHELGFDGYFATSAREGWQIDELRNAICKAIDWQVLPKVTSTILFRQIKQFLLDEKKQARRLISSVGDLYSTFLRSKDVPLETLELPAQFEMCIRRVESMGQIKRLSFGNLVLLQPELLDAYASALVNMVRDEPDGLGSIAEEQVRAGDFRMPADERIEDKEQEKLLLIAMVEDLLRRELALREEGMLVFPSQSTKENPDLPDPEGKAVVFGFEGPVLNIYATLAVRLARSGLFKKQDLWKNAVTYTASLGGTCGMYLHNIGEGRGELTLFFDKAVSKETRLNFEEYTQIHLQRRALQESLKRHPIFICNICGFVVSEQLLRIRNERGFNWLDCPGCSTRIMLLDREQRLATTPSPHIIEMDQAADKQREREAVQSTLQGKIATGNFDVVLCYNSGDKLIIKQIGEQLKELGILPWLDEWELRPGLPWQQALERQIEHIKTAAVFVGKDGIGPWQHQELDAFLREFAQRGCPVIPVLLPDAPTVKPVLPVFLRGMTWVDFRLQEPNPMQQLLWGITGKRNRENERYRE
jgi:WD40 repeat protein